MNTSGEERNAGQERGLPRLRSAPGRKIPEEDCPCRETDLTLTDARGERKMKWKNQLTAVQIG